VRQRGWKNGPWAAGALGGLVYAAMIPAAATAQLPDPTRPPDFLIQAASQQGGVMPAGGVVSSGWDLTSTLVSPQRKLAVINGQVVTQGGKIGDMTVKDIGTGEVVLTGGGHTEVIELVGQDIKTRVKDGAQGP
jgi:MSHA biogenesis protein MshK